MSDETNWVRVYTGSDFSASLLQAEIENLGVKAQVKSDRTAGLNAGFGSSGFAQVLVNENDTVKVKATVEEFMEKMK